MRWLLAALAFLLLASCASTHKGRAAQLVVASDAAADEIAAGYADLRDAREAECDAKLDPRANTVSDAKACLGVFSSDGGRKLRVAVEALVAAQLAVKLAIECDGNPLSVESSCHGSPDWAELYGALMSTWDDVRPYLEAVRSRGKQTP